VQLGLSSLLFYSSSLAKAGVVAIVLGRSVVGLGMRRISLAIRVVIEVVVALVVVAITMTEVGSKWLKGILW
jgi:hypothetical protein